jgi:hypothetical protein
MQDLIIQNSIRFFLTDYYLTCFIARLEHSVSSQALNFSQFSHSLRFFGSSSPALSHLEQGDATLLHVFGVAGN